jgi:hypothetical protein
MDFPNRNVQAQPAATGHPVPAGPASPIVRRGKVTDGDKTTRIITAVAALLVAVLLVFVALTVYGSTKNGEEGYVDSGKLQAVFLNTGQVYFGRITTLNSKYFVVKNIYYLQTSSAGTAAAASNTSVSLVKLGCELHEPYDQMVINASQVTFWENLQDNGQVAKAVATFQKQNPSGQKCSDQSSSAAATGASVQNAGTSNTSSVKGGTSTPQAAPTTNPTAKP